MQIKKFEAQNMPEALRLIKHEFGSNAVILSVRKIENGSGVFGFSRTKGIEVTAATDMQPFDFKSNRLKNNYSEYQPNPYGHSRLDPFEKKKGFIPSFRIGSGHVEKPNKSLLHNDKLRSRHTKRLYVFYRQMLEHDVDQGIALDLIRLAKRFTPSDRNPSEKGYGPCMVQVLNKAGISANRVRITNGKQQRVALIGPTGVGKTTTIAKLATAAKRRQNSRRVAIITLDENRIGAMGQMIIYAKIIGIPLKKASTKDELAEHVESLSGYDLLLIDTPGISQTNQDQIKEVRSIFDGIDNIEFHLVLSAATNDSTLRDMIDKYGVFPLNRLMFTKLDESATYGCILNQLYLSRIPASYFTNGQQVPEDIEAATTDKIANFIFNGGDGKYLSGSPEELADKIIRFERMLVNAENQQSSFAGPDTAKWPGINIIDTDTVTEKRLGGSSY